MGVSTAVGPNLVELRSVLERCKDWSVEKRTMVGLLCVLHLSVRVRHFFTQPDGLFTPKWSDEMDDLDVNELVHDISHDCVIHRFWDVTEEPPATTNIKRPATGVESNGSKKEDIPVRQLYILLETLSGKLDKMDTLIEDKVCAIITPMNEKLATMEKELQKMKEKDCADDRKEDANSIANENAEVNSKEMSWMVEINSTSHDGLPTQRVVKKPRNASKKSGNVVDDKKKMAEKKLKNKIKVPHLLDNASGEDTWSDPVQREKSKKLGDRLDALADFARKLNKYTSPTPSSPQHKRQTKLVLSQLFSFVGNSTVKRIITSVTPSVSAYDLFSAVDDEKMRKLLNFLLDKEYAFLVFLYYN
ncbi:unnamed protein product [Brassica napus]|uniref:(rape) hypothetical protein n=1 Tax=Brassica napus TaxID=3708 RepID=A0A816J8L3_BRANA|nr:unnamed protein product [Brassica napus]